MGGALVLFKKSKTDRRVTNHDKAVFKVKIQRDTVKQYQKKLENSLDQEKTLVLKLLAKGKTERAKCILRKQLLLREHLKGTDHQLEQLEHTVNALEWSGVQDKVFDGLRAGHLALKRANEVLSIKKIEIILDETAQALEKQEEINKMISVLGRTQSEESFNESVDHVLRCFLEKNRSMAGSSSAGRLEPHQPQVSVRKKTQEARNKTAGDIQAVGFPILRINNS